MLKKQSKKCIDWRHLETPRWLEESPAAPVADTQWWSPDSMDDFKSGWLEESPAAPVAGTTVVIPRQHGWFHEWMIRGITSRTSRWYHSGDLTTAWMISWVDD